MKERVRYLQRQLIAMLERSPGVNRVYHWFQEGLFRRVAKNASTLMAGKVSTAAIDLIVLSITARGLGPELFGYLVLITTYVRVVDTFVNFQSWQAIIKYGADALLKESDEDFRGLIKFGTGLDIFSAVLGFFISLVGIQLIAPLQNWTPEVVRMAQVFSIVILFNMIPTPMAVLQLFDKFHWMAIAQVSTALFRMGLLVLAFVLGWGLWAYVLTWLTMYLLYYLVLFTLSWIELRRRGYHRILATSLRNTSRRFPGIWKFVATTNLSGSLRLGTQEVDVLIVGALLGPSPTGIYKVAKQFGSIPERFAEPVKNAAYPDLAKLWSQKAIPTFRRFILRIGSLSGFGGLAIWVGFLLFGRIILEFTVGEDFLEAYGPLLVYMIGYLLFMVGVALEPAVLSSGHPGRITLVYIGAQVVYFAAMPLLLHRFGVMGASISQVIYQLGWFIALAFSIIQFTAQEETKIEGAEGEAAA